MSDDKSELSDEEYDALLSDLEGRASEGGAVDVDEDLGDIDDFLADLDTGESSEAPPKAATAQEDDDLAAEFAGLEEKGELSAPDEASKAPKKDKKKAQGEGAKEVEPSRAKRIGVAVAKSVLWFMPAVILVWLLGAYLGHWVSAGWLIALVAVAFVFATPAVLRRRIKRGTYRPWLLGFSVVVTVALVAPIPHIAGENLTSYGHWPAAAVAEIAGAESDAAFVRSAAAASGSIGTLIAPVDDPGWQARELGTAFPLGTEWSEEELEEALEEVLDD